MKTKILITVHNFIIGLLGLVLAQFTSGVWQWFLYIVNGLSIVSAIILWIPTGKPNQADKSQPD